MPSEAELVRSDDPAAFRQLYDRYAERIHRFHLSRTRAADAAHDLTAETFARAWIGRARFRDEAGGSAAPWLFGIAQYVLLESVRHRRMERTACERLGILDAIDRRPAVAVPDEQWIDGLEEAMEDLVPSQREAVRLRVLEDLAYSDVAAALGTTPDSARVRVHRALSALRTRLTSPKEATR
jgi:RNA polymerase sigma factor (sigma-70 family)